MSTTEKEMKVVAWNGVHDRWSTQYRVVTSVYALYERPTTRSRPNQF
jgi:hypothetical protein